MLLSDRNILDLLDEGSIVIDPFKRENLKTTSYDVTLGKYYYRETNQPNSFMYDPWNEQDVRGVWQLCEADKMIMLRPHETILAHTEEFVGGRGHVTTMMKARSSIGRNFIEVCKCAGWGDVGYVNRWTMEITNNSNNYIIPLRVGARIAQIVFFLVDPPIGDTYEVSGKYQTSSSLEVLRASWRPDQMLPKLWKDLDDKGELK